MVVVDANDTIFLHEGSSGTTAYVGPVTIDDDGQRLFGEGVALTIPDTLTQQTVPVPGPQTLLAAGTHPQIDSATNDVDVTPAGGTFGGIEVMGIHGIGSIHGINVVATGTDNVEVLITDNIIGTATAGPTMNGLNAVSTSVGTLEVAFNTDAQAVKPPPEKRKNRGRRRGLKKKMSIYKQRQQRTYWYEFSFAESASARAPGSATQRLARDMEAAHRTALLKGEVGIKDRSKMPTVAQFVPRFERAIETLWGTSHGRSSSTSPSAAFAAHLRAPQRVSAGRSRRSHGGHLQAAQGAPSVAVWASLVARVCQPGTRHAAPHVAACGRSGRLSTVFRASGLLRGERKP